ncbi:predicted protein [Sclerotinia sclerotiorum 1980 UF-70]|uniref:Uncharacterized protein n=1 Tax=Sclerotinia sclerotiorum (strain ATCC 18683 / 1980 / Ss-1) TaxID=665079 RepID=A7EWI2_SCLS1|nr:predicted protein [Sclerotinia sclerotiorum 1980 UF-70]EDN93824.1 predicted protein [Sclerotinia sclerotiorum 1980 UF-70]
MPTITKAAGGFPSSCSTFMCSTKKSHELLECIYSHFHDIHPGILRYFPRFTQSITHTRVAAATFSLAYVPGDFLVRRAGGNAQFQAEECFCLSRKISTASIHQSPSSDTRATLKTMGKDQLEDIAERSVKVLERSILRRRRKLFIGGD